MYPFKVLRNDPHRDSMRRCTLLSFKFIFVCLFMCGACRRVGQLLGPLARPPPGCSPLMSLTACELVRALCLACHMSQLCVSFAFVCAVPVYFVNKPTASCASQCLCRKRACCTRYHASATQSAILGCMMRSVLHCHTRTFCPHMIIIHARPGGCCRG